MRVPGRQYRLGTLKRLGGETVAPVTAKRITTSGPVTSLGVGVRISRWALVWGRPVLADDVPPQAAATRSAWRAPVGHRQPTMSDLPPDVARREMRPGGTASLGRAYLGCRGTR